MTPAYRIFSVIEKCYLYNYQAYVNANGLVCMVSTNSPYANQELFIVEKCTTRIDKNGEWIYEGDITDNGEVKWFKDIVFDGGCAGHPGFYFIHNDPWTVTERDCELIDTHEFDESIEVLGNIHFNPELLEKGRDNEAI